MIGKLIGGATSLGVYLMTATVLAQAIIVGGLWASGRLNATSVMQIRALLQGTDITDLVPDDDRPEASAGPVEPSLVEIQRAQAITMFNLQKKSEEVSSLYTDVRRERQEVEQQLKILVQRIDQFNQQMLDYTEQATTRGMAAVRDTLANMEPAQAKDQLLLMIEDGRDTEVVGIFRKMTVDARVAILAEFTGEEEEVANILEKMARGTPEVDLVEDTLGPRKVWLMNELDRDGPLAEKIRRFLDDLFPKTAQNTPGGL